MAIYANIDDGDEGKMPAISLKFAKPIFQLMAKSPGNTAFALLMGVGIVWAGANAILGQADVHPAPYFAPAPSVVAPLSHQTAPTPLPKPVETSQPVAALGQPAADFGSVKGNPDAFLVQSRLYQLGYFTQEVDGYYGPKTAEAIRAFELENGLTPTGALSDELVDILSSGKIKRRATVAQQSMPQALGNSADPLLQIAQQTTSDGPAQNVVTRDMVILAQKGLASLGYEVGEIDGIAGEATTTAIRRFENFSNYPQTGEISSDLFELLKIANAKF